MGEPVIERGILEYLNMLPYCRAYKTPNQGSKGVRKKAAFKGKSDIACCFHGLYIAIEVKTKDGVQSQDQKDFEKDIRDAMGIYWLVRSVEDVVVKIRHLRGTYGAGK